MRRSSPWGLSRRPNEHHKSCVLPAMLAAQGFTNRQIGERLLLSHRTVGAHLYRVFPKLGISTRGQLSAALTERLGAADGSA
jgi:FixJ family two-component response regulator